jgi:CII-binding regulator of phage lambda lysogenization HflD
LVEAASNVISIAFNFLTEDKLKDLEAKDYASKNMMINMQSIYRETINAIQGSIQSLYNENN